MTQTKTEPSSEISNHTYVAFPLQVHNPNEATVRKCRRIFSEFLGHENFFTDYRKGCEEKCGSCDRCLSVKKFVAETLLDRKSICWEVWEEDPEGNLVDIVGILRLSRVDPGCDAVAHYFFFDHRLQNKTELLEWWRDWVFEDRENWVGLNRVTVEIPSHSFALARHAVKRLGFGGPFEYESGDVTIPVEGVKTSAKKKDGRWFDMLILGLKKEDLSDEG